MKTFNEYLESKGVLNEISADLLRKSADVASQRGDTRGQRLSGKFTAAADVRSPTVELIGPEGKKKYFLVRDIVKSKDRHEAIDLIGRGNEKISIFGLHTPVATVSPHYDFDRMNAIILTKAINEKLGTNIKPTQLPMI